MALQFPRYVYDSGSGNVIIDFLEPIAEDPHPSVQAVRKDAFSGKGIRQSVHHFNDEVYTLVHQFETESIIDAVQTMMDTWTLLGNEFDFYEDQTITGVFKTLEVLDKTFRPRRMNKKLDIWEFRIRARLQIT